MKGDPEERAAAVGRYIVESGATVRAAAAVFGVSKSTIWKDQHRLRRQNPGLWAEVQAVVQKNKAERHLRGGEATRRKYLACFRAFGRLKLIPWRSFCISANRAHQYGV